MDAAKGVKPLRRADPGRLEPGGMDAVHVGRPTALLAGS